MGLCLAIYGEHSLGEQTEILYLWSYRTIGVERASLLTGGLR